MPGVFVSPRIEVKNVLYLTDFSARSDEALSFAKAIGRAYGSQIYAVHILVPDALTYMSPDSITAAIELQREFVVGQMQRVEAQLRGLPHNVVVEQGREVWATLTVTVITPKCDLSHIAAKVRLFMIQPTAWRQVGL